MSGEIKLAGQVALVTGAGKRLGRAVALRLAREGADVAVHYGQSEAEAREVVAAIEAMGRKAAAFSAELTDVRAIEKLVADVAARFGRLDILVNSAANFQETKFGEKRAGSDCKFRGYRGLTGVVRIPAAFAGEIRRDSDDTNSGERACAARAGECHCAGNDHHGGRSGGVARGLRTTRAAAANREGG